MSAVVTVRFVTTDGFVSASIRKVTGSLFSHVEFGTPEGTWIGAHVGDGVKERPANYCTCTREYVYEIPCSPTQQDNLLKWARSKCGVQYNTFDIVGLLLKNRRWTTPQKYICSQFVCEGLLEVFGAPRVLNVLKDYAYLITPETLHLSPIFVGKRVKKVG